MDRGLIQAQEGRRATRAAQTLVSASGTCIEVESFSHVRTPSSSSSSSDYSLTLVTNRCSNESHTNYPPRKISPPSLPSLPFPLTLTLLQSPTGPISSLPISFTKERKRRWKRISFRRSRVRIGRVREGSMEVRGKMGCLLRGKMRSSLLFCLFVCLQAS